MVSRYLVFQTGTNMILTKSSLKLTFLFLFCKTPYTCGTNHKEQAILTKPIGYSTLTNCYFFTND